MSVTFKPFPPSEFLQSRSCSPLGEKPQCNTFHGWTRFYGSVPRRTRRPVTVPDSYMVSDCARELCWCEDDWYTFGQYYVSDIPPCPPAPAVSHPSLYSAAPSYPYPKAKGHRNEVTDSEEEVVTSTECRCACDHLINGSYRQLKEVMYILFCIKVINYYLPIRFLISP